MDTATGRKLAVDMLTEFRASNADETSIEPRHRPGMAQSDILARYLRIAIDHQNPAIEAGFFAVLTDHLGMAAEGGVVDDPAFYNQLDANGNARGFTLGVSTALPKAKATNPGRSAVAKVIPLHVPAD